MKKACNISIAREVGRIALVLIMVFVTLDLFEVLSLTPAQQGDVIVLILIWVVCGLVRLVNKMTEK